MKIHGEPQFTVLRCDEMQYDTALAHLMLSTMGSGKFGSSNHI